MRLRSLPSSQGERVYTEGNAICLVPPEFPKGDAMTKTDTLRGRFEAWAVNECADLGLGRRADNGWDYWDPRTHFAWRAYEAAQLTEAEIEELAREIAYGENKIMGGDECERIASLLRGKMGGTR